MPPTRPSLQHETTRSSISMPAPPASMVSPSDSKHKMIVAELESKGAKEAAEAFKNMDEDKYGGVDMEEYERIQKTEQEVQKMNTLVQAAFSPTMQTSVHENLPSLSHEKSANRLAP